MVMTNQQTTELTKQRFAAFDDPAPLVASQFPAILVAPLLVVLPVGCNQFDASPFPSLPKRSGVVAAVCDHSVSASAAAGLWV